MEDHDLKCVKMHDRCYGGDGKPCPYCETNIDPNKSYFKEYLIFLKDMFKSPIFWRGFFERLAAPLFIFRNWRKDK